MVDNFRFQDMPIPNMEMETAGWNAFAKMPGFNCISLDTILTNRTINRFSQNPEKQIDKLMTKSLEILAA